MVMHALAAWPVQHYQDMQMPARVAVPGMALEQAATKGHAWLHWVTAVVLL